MCNSPRRRLRGGVNTCHIEWQDKMRDFPEETGLLGCTVFSHQAQEYSYISPPRTNCRNSGRAFFHRCALMRRKLGEGAQNYYGALFGDQNLFMSKKNLDNLFFKGQKQIKKEGGYATIKRVPN